MKILVHVCCADCGIKLVDSIKNKFEEIVVYYYNPNIHPRSEYFARLKALQLVFEKEKRKLVIPDWQPKDYFKVVQAKEKPNSSSSVCPSHSPALGFFFGNFFQNR